MISPAKLDKLPSDMVNLIQDLQNDIIKDVCRRFSKANYLTPTAEWQLYKANQLQLSYNEVNRRIARFLKVRERDIQRLYTDTVKQALKEDGDIYRLAAAMGKLPDNTGEKIQNYFRSAAFSQLLSKGLKNCKNGVRNLCNSMAAAVNSDLSYAMDYAHIQVLSGAFSYSDAIYNAVKKLTEGGLTRVEYPSGRRDNVDVCVRRAVLSSVNKSCCDLQLDLAREVGSKYVEVSAHMGARPSHAQWQGQIYCLEKGDPKYPYFYDATGYGTGDGLGGWNCRHNFFPYFPGIDTPYHKPEFTRTENNEYYALTQRQRAMERAVRSSKRELAALDGARSGTDDPNVRKKLDNEFARKSVTLKSREKRLDDFVRDKGLVKENDRTRVVGFGRSVSGKAAWANRRASAIVLNAEPLPGTSFKPIEYFDSKEYRDKFKSIRGLNPLSRYSLYSSAKEAIKKNYGKMSETVVVTDRFSGLSPIQENTNGINVQLTLPPGKKDQYILIHNHPNNGPLSIADTLTLNNRKDIKTMIAATHDGKLYWLEIGNGKRLTYNNDMEKRFIEMDWQRRVVANDNNHYKALLSFAKEYGWKAGCIE